LKTLKHLCLRFNCSISDIFQGEAGILEEGEADQEARSGNGCL
jgi:hypothetical protein